MPGLAIAAGPAAVSIGPEAVEALGVEFGVADGVGDVSMPEGNFDFCRAVTG